MDRAVACRAEPAIHAIGRGTTLAATPHVLLAITTLWVLGVLAGSVAGSGRTRGALGIAFGGAALGAPWLVPPEHTLIRCLLALGAMLVVIRAIDLARDRRSFPVRVRIGLMFCLFDLRQAERTPAGADVRQLGAGVLWLAACAGSWSIALHVAGPVRWLAGAAGMVAAAEAGAVLAGFFSKLAGYRIPKQHDQPVLAISVGDFWSRRWNLNVRDWLFRNCHRPLARRGFPRAGTALAFAVSALLHFFMVLVPLGSGWAAVMASFFLLQALLVLVEARIGQARWPAFARRAWTITALLGSSPLFIEPVLKIVG
jgi:hypothetical protein